MTPRYAIPTKLGAIGAGSRQPSNRRPSPPVLSRQNVTFVAGVSIHD